jgi:hypothetical protein
MIDTQVIAMHFPSTTVRRPISTADTQETLRSPVAGDEASIHRQQTPPTKFLQATATVSTGEPREDHFSLQEYLTFLEIQREQMEIFMRKKIEPRF